MTVSEGIFSKLLMEMSSFEISYPNNNFVIDWK